MKAISILKPGLLTSVQDMGRYNYRKFGVPVSGAMDRFSAALANHLLNKILTSPLLELSLHGPVILFHSDTFIAITGADISPDLNGMKLDNNAVYPVKEGQQLSFGKINYGARAYIAFQEDLETDFILGSHAYCKGITPLQQVKPEQKIIFKDKQNSARLTLSRVKVSPEHFSNQAIKVYKGPEFDLLEFDQQKVLWQSSFHVGQENNRMGIRLSGPSLIVNNGASMLTSAVLPGTVQLTPSGQLIVLMRDCQTTGGYPRILQLSEISINQLAQKKAGDSLKFIL